ncbi:ABC transporter permease [Permianibacter sp. IMCC34836]|uniref:ABC transporter permease n=1 Tax=Permianibacter fluminis TaxID=2738515 RepID=UPI0015557EE7|nr:ABC transporter permease [Permianibacter fluminis]NQD37107.1 ABC transporter permease [Permianibacter fluminis]
MNHSIGKTVLLMARKDFQLLLTDKVTLFFTFVFPLLFALLFGGMMGGGNSGRQISLVLVQEDASSAAQEFAGLLKAAPELQITEQDRSTAAEQVRKGEKTAYLIIPAGFGERWQAGFAGTFSGQVPTVQLGVDPAREAEAGMLQGVLMKYAAERFKTLFAGGPALQQQMQSSIQQIETSADMPAEWRSLLLDYLPKMQTLLAKQAEAPTAANRANDAGFLPLKIDAEAVAIEKKGPGNAYAVLFPQSMMWSVLGCLMGFGVSLVQERSRGTLQRLQAAPVNAASILAGKALACALTQMAVMSLLLVIAHVFFRVPLPHPLALIAAVLAITVCFSGIMTLMAAIAQTEQAVNGMGWAVLMVLAMIGGSMIPLFLMPPWLQTVSHISPIKWGILSLEGAIWRDFSSVEMLLPLTVLLAIGLLAYGGGVWRFRRETLAG